MTQLSFVIGPVIAGQQAGPAWHMRGFLATWRWACRHAERAERMVPYC